MTKREFERRAHQARTLQDLGFTAAEGESLRRISNTLQRWHELECGTERGCIERDDTTGKAYWRSAQADRRYLIADREAGAKKRLADILARRNSEGDIQDHASGGCTITKRAPLAAFVQTDPRGAALYILRPGDVPAGEDAGAYYTRGICVY